MLKPAAPALACVVLGLGWARIGFRCFIFLLEHISNALFRIVYTFIGGVVHIIVRLVGSRIIGYLAGIIHLRL